MVVNIGMKKDARKLKEALKNVEGQETTELVKMPTVTEEDQDEIIDDVDNKK